MQTRRVHKLSLLNQVKTMPTLCCVISIFFLSFLTAPTCLHAAVASVNPDKCACLLEGPTDDSVCTGEPFKVTLTLTANTSLVHNINASVILEGAGADGATATPSTITQCPTVQVIIITPKAGVTGELKVKVMSCEYIMHLLPNQSGSWGTTHEASPETPPDFDKPYDRTYTEFANIATIATVRVTGKALYRYSVLRQTDTWWPDRDGVPCGEEYAHQVTATVEGSVTANAPWELLGLDAEFKISGSVSDSTTISLGEKGVHKRWRAYAVWPQETITDNVSTRVKTTYYVGGTTHTDSLGPPPDSIVAVNYISGKDWHIEAACCP